MEITSKGFKKPAENEFYDIDIFNNNAQLTNDLFVGVDSAIGQIASDLNTHKVKKVTKTVLVTEPYNQLTKTTIDFGFKPNGITIIANILATKYESIGSIDDSSNGLCMHNYVDTGDKNITGGIVVFAKDTSSTIRIIASITFTPTGIELNWTKDGDLGIAGTPNRRLIVTAYTHGGV